mmetsp:Transcript_25626/g.74080  ORF Transcript_25626/g.74080 Transcript_25626/m.74080 type:complete len:326 (+) Transcript_25626:308-1285(+)
MDQATVDQDDRPSRAEGQAEADGVDDVGHVHEQGQHVDVDEGRLDVDGGADLAEAPVRALQEVHDAAVGRRGHGRDEPVLGQAADDGGRPHEDAARGVPAALQMRGLAGQQPRKGREWLDGALARELLGTARVQLGEGLGIPALRAEQAPGVRHALRPLGLPPDPHVQVHAQQPGREEGVPDGQGAPLLGDPQGAELHVQVPHRVQEVQEAAHAVVPAAHGRGHEEAQHQADKKVEEGANLLEFVNLQAHGIVHGEGNNGSGYHNHSHQAQTQQPDPGACEYRAREAQAGPPRQEMHTMVFHGIFICRARAGSQPSPASWCDKWR